MYLEQLCFAINRAGWSATKIYLHDAFEQERFKENSILTQQTFVLMKTSFVFVFRRRLQDIFKTS